MGTGQSKNLPDEQMRMKMENGFDEDDEDVKAIGLLERDRSIRSKSNLSFHTTERFQNEDEEYFNKIYNQRADKSVNSLNSSSLGVKSAPVGIKKEKDPEVAAAIAELEETFKVLGEGPLTSNTPQNNKSSIIENENGSQHFLIDHSSPSLESPSPTSENSAEYSNDSNLVQDLNVSEEVLMSQLQYDRRLITRARVDESYHGGAVYNNTGRRPSKLIDLISRETGTNGQPCVPHSRSSIISPCRITTNSRGSEPTSFTLPNHSNIKRGRSHNSQSILRQQKLELQRRNIDGNVNASNMLAKTIDVEENPEDWTYEPPKIEGFDVAKFKEVNSKDTRTTVVPIILRDEEDKGYYSRSPDIPSYTKDELDLIASLEREVY